MHFFFSPNQDIEKPTHASPGTLSAEASWARWWIWSYFISFYSWSFLTSNMCVSILLFFSHFSCGILIFQFVGLFLGFCFFTHFSGGILIFLIGCTYIIEVGADISRFFRRGASLPCGEPESKICPWMLFGWKSATEFCWDQGCQKGCP